MVHLRLVRTRPAPAHASPEACEKKTASLSQAFDELFEKTSGAFRDRRVQRRAHVLARANSVCLGRRTVSGLLTACGRQFEDWSASYRLFERRRFRPDRLFAVPLQAVTEHLAPEAPLVAVMDDTLFPRKGRRVSGAAWRHNPQGPFFAHQITWSQRAVELCAMLPANPAGACSARAVPVRGDKKSRCDCAAARNPESTKGDDPLTPSGDSVRPRRPDQKNFRGSVS